MRITDLVFSYVDSHPLVFKRKVLYFFYLEGFGNLSRCFVLINGLLHQKPHHYQPEGYYPYIYKFPVFQNSSFGSLRKTSPIIPYFGLKNKEIGITWRDMI
ncbi:hypothetical protein ES703_103528 [subsurface metagenome]